MQAVILAGGRGTRLGYRALNLPKPMIPVGGRPFLEYVLDGLVDDGITGVILSVGHKAQAIRVHFGSSYRGMPLTYAIETEPLGTGGAIANALANTGNEPALVLNGDTLLKIDFSDLIKWYVRDPAPVAIVLRQMEEVARYGAVVVEGERVAGFSEKGRSGSGLINAGVYVIQPDVLRTFGLPRVFAFESDFLQRYCVELRPRAYVTRAYFIDIGIPSDLDRAQAELPNLAL